MAQERTLILTCLGNENRPRLELDERDAGGLLGDAGDKSKGEGTAS